MIALRQREGAIDVLPTQGALGAMLAAQIAAVEVVRSALVEVQRAAELVALAFEAGHSVHYAAAGSSGLMALADACELPGTFGVSQSQIKIHMAGGVPADGVMPGGTEDERDAAALSARDACAGDVVIVVSASGTTPYALGFAEAALARGACVVGIANVPGTPLMEMADVPIVLETVAEVVEGSTRLGAGTAQKVALNMISTQAGILMGHVHDGMMVNLAPENIKLRKRAADIVSRIANVPVDRAGQVLVHAGFDTKCAILMAAGASSRESKALLQRHNGYLRECLEALSHLEKTND
ncbi:MAG: N-acetylmuramic acid 6-phosphate etherase [Roseobacter sp.]